MLWHTSVYITYLYLQKSSMGRPLPLVTSPVVTFLESRRVGSMSAHSFPFETMTSVLRRSLFPMGLNQGVPRQIALSILSAQGINFSILEIFASTASREPTCGLGQVQNEK